MKRITKVAFTLFFPLMVVACSQTPDQLVIAKVNGEKVRAKDLIQSFQEEKDHFDTDLLQSSAGILAIKKKILNDLIQTNILLQQVKDKKITLTPEEETKLQDATAFGFTDGEFLRQLHLKKTTKEEWTEKQREKKLFEKLFDQEIFQKVTLGSNEVESYYRKNKDEFSVPDQVHCKQIIVDKKEKAEKIASLLDNGSNFQELAQQHSEGLEKNKGGDLGWIARGQYPKVIENACFTLGVGQTSGVISSEYGYHIFRVMERRSGFQKPLSEVKEAIQDTLRKEKGNPLLQAWVNSIYAESKISVDERALKEVVFKL